MQSGHIIHMCIIKFTLERQGNSCLLCRLSRYNSLPYMTTCQQVDCHIFHLQISFILSHQNSFWFSLLHTDCMDSSFKPQVTYQTHDTKVEWLKRCIVFTYSEIQRLQKDCLDFGYSTSHDWTHHKNYVLL